MTFTDLFIRRPVLALVVNLLILLVGARAIYDLPIRQYPRLENTVITVTTVYPGASADLMQGFISTPIEQVVSSAEGIDYLTSSSTQGRSVVTAYIRLNYDQDRAMTDIMAKVQQVRFQLPREANDPIILKSTGQTTALMYIGFSSAELGGAAISDYLTRIVQPLLATVEGVAEAQILGGQTFAMRIWLDPDRMASRGVTASDLAQALRANNVQAAPGQAKGPLTVTNITAGTGLSSAADFEQMVVKADTIRLVRLRDIARVELGPKSSDASVRMNGESAIFIGVQPSPSGNPLNVVEGVRNRLIDIQRTLPPTVKMQVAYDATRFIKASIEEVVMTLAEDVLIVVVIIFLFLGSFRSVLIPIVTIPLSLIGAGILMLALGFSLNLLTLLAFVLAIGLVVDDAIVVVENVHRHIEEGRSPVQAALIGAREIAGPVISMTITLAAVYAPIGFLSGLTGSLFREFAFTLAGAVIISGVVALTLSPMMASLLLRPAANEGWLASRIERTFDAVTRWYSRRLTGALDYRPVTLLFAAGVLASLPFLYFNIRAELAPEEDQGVLFGVTKAPQYANLDYVESYAGKVDQAFASYAESELRFMINGLPLPTQGFAGMILKPWSERTRSTKELQQPVQQDLAKVEGLQVLLFSPPALPGTSGGLPVQMVIASSAPYEEIFKAMEALKTAARDSGLVIVADSDLEFNSPVIRINVERAKANSLGLTMQSIAETLAVLVGENFVNRFNLAGRSYEVIPQVPRELRTTPDSLTRYFVSAPGGRQIPLSTVVSVETGIQPNALTKYNQLAAATFSAVPLPGVSIGQAVDFLEARARALPQGFSHSYLSQARQYVTEGHQLAITFAFAIVVIYLVLAAQYESLRDPLVILISVPLSIWGALLPLFIGLASMNIYTQVGLVTLIGLIAKHGILMVEFARDLQIGQGLDRRQAIEQAAVVRLRPILMTTAAMVVGLVPLLIASGAGAASRFSIGLVIVAGMSIGTLFTLLVLPAVYTLLAEDHRAAAGSQRRAEIEAIARGV